MRKKEVKVEKEGKMERKGEETLGNRKIRGKQWEGRARRGDSLKRYGGKRIKRSRSQNKKGNLSNISYTHMLLTLTKFCMKNFSYASEML